MILNYAKSSFPRSTMTLLGSVYLMSHSSSTILDTRSARAKGTVQISIQPVAGSIIVTAYKQMVFLLVI